MEMFAILYPFYPANNPANICSKISTLGHISKIISFIELILKIPFEGISKGIFVWLRYQDSNLGRQNQNL